MNNDSHGDLLGFLVTFTGAFVVVNGVEELGSRAGLPSKLTRKVMHIGKLQHDAGMHSS